MMAVRRLLALDEGILTHAALAGVVLTPVVAVVAAAWVSDLAVLYPITIAGLFVGLLFARAGLPGAMLHLLSLALGSAVVVELVSRLLPFADRADRIRRLWRRLLDWLHIALSGGFAADNLLFVLLLAGVAWLVAYTAAWAVFRRRSAWWPLFAAGTALLLNVNRAPELRGYVLLFAVCGLLLILSLNLSAEARRWRSLGLAHSPGIVGPVVRTGVLLAGTLAVVAWYAPQAAAQVRWQDAAREVLRPWESVQQEFGRLFGGLRSREVLSLSGFGNQLELRGRFRLTEDPVMRVWASERHYWRAIVYHDYTGRGWTIEEQTALIDWPAGDSDAPQRGFEARHELRQRFQILAPKGNYVFAANEPVRVDVPVVAERPLFRGGVDASDLLALRSRDLRSGSVYQVVSQVSHADVAALRQAGDVYPRQVVERYATPPTTTPQVRQLARRLTDGESNPYDKARVVESYLRQFPYSLELAPPPAGRDGVDYFLFDVQTGYCDYFATAMAVMLRSVGVPARVASGYAGGELEEPGGPFLVRESTAHSWVEVYFPRYGWIEFEPSANRPALQRGASLPPTPTSAPRATPRPTIPTRPTPVPSTGDAAAATPTPTPTSAASSGSTPNPPSAVVLDQLRAALALLRVPALLLAGLGLLIALIRLLWNRGLADLPLVARLWAECCRIGSLLGRGPRPWQTPHEYAEQLVALDPARHDLPRQIAGAYAAHRFGGVAEPPEGRQLATAWRSFRARLVWWLIRARR